MSPRYCYLSKISANKSLLYPTIECQHHQQFLVGRVPPVLERLRRQLERQLPLLSTTLLVQLDFVQRKNDDQEGNNCTSSVNATYCVYLGGDVDINRMKS